MLRTNPQLKFHAVHGKNIELYGDQTKAKRSHAYFNGLTFSHRPIHPMEQVNVKILDTKPNSRYHTIRFGFTARDPNEIENRLAVRAPESTHNRSIYWTFPLETYREVKGKVLSFYFTTSGSFHYVCEGIEWKRHTIPPEPKLLWAVIDLFGTCTNVQFLGVRGTVPQTISQPMNGSLSDSVQVADEDACKICYQRAMNAALKSCGHLLCVGCAKKLTLCPFCCAKINGVLRIYKP